MPGRNYRDLLAWQQAMDLAYTVYQATIAFPCDERYGLVAQMRRAAVSVPSNIAEGQGRRSKGAFCQHLSIAHGSLRELETQVLLSVRLDLLKEDASRELLDRASEVGRLVTGLLNSVQAVVEE